MRVVKFISRPEAEKLVPEAGAVLISIRNDNQVPIEPQPGWASIHESCFADVDIEFEGVGGLFNAALAKAMLEFVRQHSAASELVVHCQAGLSRSAAVALFFAGHLEIPCLKNGQLVAPATWPLFNRRVLRTLEHAAYGVGSAFGTIEAP